LLSRLGYLHAAERAVINILFLFREYIDSDIYIYIYKH
jgi:hypothetical protein